MSLLSSFSRRKRARLETTPENDVFQEPADNNNVGDTKINSSIFTWFHNKPQAQPQQQQQRQHSVVNDENNSNSHRRRHHHTDSSFSRKTNWIDSETHQPVFTFLPDVVSKDLGGRVLFTTDEFFGCASDLLKPEEPNPHLNEYGYYGKIVDGWETRRRRTAGHDWAIIQLCQTSLIKGLEIDTCHFVSNYPPSISIEGADWQDLEQEISHLIATRYPEYHNKSASQKAGNQKLKTPEIITESSPDRQQQQRQSQKNIPGFPYAPLKTMLGCPLLPQSLIDDVDALLESRKDQWVDILSTARLSPGTESSRKNYFAVLGPASNRRWSHIRVNIFPDGGIARLRVYGEPVLSIPRMRLLAQNCGGQQYLNLLSANLGAAVLWWSDMGFAHPKNLLSPNPPVNMSRGWETSRQPCRPPVIVMNQDESQDVSTNFLDGESCIFKLAFPCIFSSFSIDTKFNLGNAPFAFRVEVMGDLSLFHSPCLDQRTFFQSNASSLSTTMQELIPLTLLHPHVTQTFYTEKANAPNPGLSATLAMPAGDSSSGDAVVGQDAIMFPKHLWNMKTMSTEVPAFPSIITHVKLTIIPDGGISSFRFYGVIDPEAAATINPIPPACTDRSISTSRTATTGATAATAATVAAAPITSTIQGTSSIQRTTSIQGTAAAGASSVRRRRRTGVVTNNSSSNTAEKSSG